MNDPAASGGVSSFVLGRHSVLDLVCPVLVGATLRRDPHRDTGESRIVFWIPGKAPDFL